MDVVKVCWNDFFSKVNDKNMIKSGGCSNYGMNFLSELSKYVRMIFLVNLITKKWENIWDLSNYDGMTKKK